MTHEFYLILAFLRSKLERPSRHVVSKAVGSRRNQKKEDSINRLTDPFDNSICEKCANVKKAFVVNIAPAVFPQVENGQQSQDYFL